MIRNFVGPLVFGIAPIRNQNAMNAKSLFVTPAWLLTGVKTAARDIAENATEAMICPAVINVYRCLFVRVPVDSVGLGERHIPLRNKCSMLKCSLCATSTLHINPPHFNFSLLTQHWFTETSQCFSICSRIALDAANACMLIALH